MRALSASLGLAVALVWLALVAACSRPQPPTLTPKQVTVTGVTLAGIELRMQVEAYNPNAFDLAARSVTAKILLDGKYDAGTVTVASGVTLPANKTTTLDVPASAKWTDLTQLATLAASNRPIPFAVEGTAAIGGEKINVAVPFHIDGVLTPEQLAEAAKRSLPGLVPGLFPGR